MHDINNVVNGKLQQSSRWIQVEDPATGAPYAQVADSDKADVDRAVASAQAAFPAWARTPASERSRLLLRLADLIDANLASLARAESIDTGKPISLATSLDIPRSASNLRYFATAVLHTSSEAHDFDGGGGGGWGGVPGGIASLNFTLRSPRGVAGLISPWNLPLYLLTWKIAPALATGNTAVCKPSEFTPATATILGQLATEAGFPPGVLNIVHGTGPSAGAAIVQHPDVPTISFTGSTAVGRWIASAAGDRLKRVSLELGGKNPFIVFPDAGTEDALSTAVRAGFSNQGQICLCGSRLLIHESIYRDFRDAFVQRVRAVRIGDPLDPSTQFGSLTSRQHFEKVSRAVEDARQLGGRILCGGSRVPASELPERCKDGYFYQPTVIEGLAPECRVEQDEIFGPVVTLQPFRDDEHALQLANGTPYGLAATLFTENLTRAHRFAHELNAGIVWINCWLARDLRTPFGGAKQSGVGREGGLEAIKFFTEPKNICIKR
jgi:aminomuconate-semialdehyde/2-hydroxymuconate-6-semialdehyde dehydrogenase